MDKLIRTTLIATAALAFAGCGDSGQTSANATSTDAAASSERTAYERPDDHAIGNPDAAVTVVEYASVSCGACANWYQTVYPEFKEKYIDTGKVRFVFREFLAGEPTMADAGFMIALCAPEENYFKNIKLQFDRQSQLFEFARNGQLREAYINLAKSSGLTEEEFISCMGNQELRAEYEDRMQAGLDAGITGTPGFVINGTKQNVFTLESFDDVILPLLGEEPTTEEDPAPVEEATE